MKFNWGHGIVLLMIGFVVFIATLVYGTFQERVDLSSEDYYQQEVDYDDEKTSLENGLDAGEVEVKVTASELEITLPKGNWSDVKYLLKRPDNADYDVEGYAEKIDTNFTFNVNRPRPLGWWNIEITAVSGSEDYRWEFKKYF